ncbi:abortive infection family protein [Rossellomorea sp. NRS-1567]|uniref:abortive infection family protein n=1 Tax=Rossellomorea sp. NRS-1567 TaxID=3233901 RepID=UPI003D2988D2
MGNATVSQLENCKLALRKTYDDFVENNQYDIDDYNKYLSDDDYKQSRLVIMRLCKEQDIEVPSIIKNCRTVEEYIQDLSYDYNSNYADNLGYISTQFNSFIDILEMEEIEVQIIHIDCEIPKELSYNHILEDISKCEDRVNKGDYSGALTSARSLIEGVCKEIIFNIEGKEVDTKPQLPDLFREVRNHLNLDPSNQELHKPLKEVISGLIKVVHGLNEVRNLSGDMHARKINPSLHHALLVVNSAKTVVNFLFHTYEYQRNLGKIKIPT